MNSFLGRRMMTLACLAALAVATAAPVSALDTRPDTSLKKSKFRLLARAGGSIRVNQVTCGILSDGQICVDSTGSSTIPGSVWPKGTNNQYTFNSGISIAGIIGPELPAWAGDTTGAFFFDGAGKSNAEQVFPIYNASDPADFNNWPEYARVPSGTDPGAAVFDPLLQGTISASQGDVWFMSWDGNPTLNVGRPHPLGVAVETRGLAWNFPTGNQDVLYFIYTLYNITSARDADYATVRPSLRTELLRIAKDFQARNSAAFGITIPEGGYSITNAFMDFAADQDVTVDAAADYATFNNTFNLAITYHEVFRPQPGNVFDPGIHAPPFMPGPGFVGTKYLRSPILPDGTEAGTVLAGLTTNRGSFPDPNNTSQLYRYISGNLNPAAGDPQCNTGDPKVTHICFINNVPSDTRTFQSSGPLTLAPGGQATIVVAYIFAPPLATTKCPSVPCPVTMTPNPLLITNATASSPGVDAIDSAMGYRGIAPGTPTPVPQDSVRTFPNSLLGKAKVAQAIFDSKFLLPFAPTAPEFFLIPGDGQVSIVWAPSASEQSGDAFFGIANDPTSLQYDPSYRQFDVEGYRVYRGRTDTPNQLELVAQFDKAGTVIYDFRGLINPKPTCAPELGIPAVLPDTACPFTIPPAGQRFTDSVAVPLAGPIIQTKPLGGRVALATGQALVIGADTAITGGGSRLPALAPDVAPTGEASATGIPFAYTDNGSGKLAAPRNNVRYFYSVTAFDMNSFTSGPSSLESQRVTKAITPARTAPNVEAASLTGTISGDDGVALDPSVQYHIDPATGRFIGAPPPTDGVQAMFAHVVPVLLPATSIAASIDSVKALSISDPACEGQFNAAATTCYIFDVSFTRDGAESKFTVPVGLPFSSLFGDSTVLNAQLGALPVQPDPDAVSRFGVAAGTGTTEAAIGIRSEQYIDWSSMEGQAARRNRFGLNTANPICSVPPANSVSRCGAAVSPGGSRWFSGADETVDNPAVSIRVGHLPGVDTVFAPIPFVDVDPVTPDGQASANGGANQIWEFGVAGLSREADVQLTWGDNGAVASVRDVTHHVPVSFKPDAQASYGFVTDADADGVISWQDFNFIPGVAVFWAENVGDLGPVDPANPGAVPLVPTPTVSGVSTAFAGPYVATGQGFGLYIDGERYIFQLTGGAVPPAGTVWTLRTYSGRVTADNNPASATPSGYRFTPTVRSPVVAGLRVQFNIAHPTQIAETKENDLSRVHTVPDPYYVTNGFETTTTDKVIKFVNLPTRAIIRIYSSSGTLVSLLEHNSTTLGGDENWNVRNRNNQVVASGVYFYHIEAGSGRRVGRFTVVNFAQ